MTHEQIVAKLLTLKDSPVDVDKLSDFLCYVLYQDHEPKTVAGQLRGLKAQTVTFRGKYTIPDKPHWWWGKVVVAGHNGPEIQLVLEPDLKHGFQVYIREVRG